VGGYILDINLVYRRIGAYCGH